MNTQQLRRLYEIKAERFNASLEGNYGKLSILQLALLSDMDDAYSKWAQSLLAEAD